MQVVVKNSDPANMLSSPISIAKHEKYITIERLDIIATTIPSKQK
jgi:hypothetical protein